MIDTGRLDDLLARLAPADAVLIVQTVAELRLAAAAPWQQRRARLRWRNVRVIQALGYHEGLPTARAKSLERLLRRRATSHQPARNLAEERGDAVLAANGGRALGWRVIYDTAAAYGLPGFAEKTEPPAKVIRQGEGMENAAP